MWFIATNIYNYQNRIAHSGRAVSIALKRKVSVRCKNDLDYTEPDIYLLCRSIFHASFIMLDLNQVQLVERKKKWVLYDDAGNVVIVATNLKTCRLIMARMQDEQANILKERLSA